jgi:carboxypeptidase PM20D1
LFYSGLSAQHSSEKEKAINTLSELIKIRSISGKEKEAAIFFEKLCKENYLHTKVLGENDSTYNFIASIYPLETCKKSIVLLNHIDVVSEGDSSLWQHPPFSGLVINDTIWGRGAIDNKGSAVMQFMALLSFLQTAKEIELPFNVIMLTVSGEETGGKNGAKTVADNYLYDINPVVVLGEGGAGMKGLIRSKPNLTVFGISIAEKKSLWLNLSLKTKNYGHGSMPPKRYANKTLLSVLHKLTNEREKIEFEKSNRLMFKHIGRLEGGIKGFVIRNMELFLFKPFVRKKLISDSQTLALVSNTSVISNIYNPPGPPNQIANEAYAILDCRLLPSVKTKNYIRNLKLSILEPRLNIDIIEESPTAKALKLVYPGSEVVPMLFPATTDNSYFREKDIPTFGIVPIEVNNELIESIHNINERIPVNALMKGISTYKTFLNRVLFDKDFIDERNKN